MIFRGNHSLWKSSVNIPKLALCQLQNDENILRPDLTASLSDVRGLIHAGRFRKHSFMMNCIYSIEQREKSMVPRKGKRFCLLRASVLILPKEWHLLNSFYGSDQTAYEGHFSRFALTCPAFDHPEFFLCYNGERQISSTAKPLYLPSHSQKSE